MSDITIRFSQDAHCVSTGRNGDYTTTGITLSRTQHTRKDNVTLKGITSKGQPARGDIELPAEVMDQLCAKWIASRGEAFSQDVTVAHGYYDKTFQVRVNDVGIDISVVDEEEGPLLVSALDTFYLRNDANDLPKTGYFQTVLYEPQPGYENPIACAVATDDGLIIHADDGGEAAKDSSMLRMSHERWYLRTNQELYVEL